MLKRVLTYTRTKDTLDYRLVYKTNNFNNVLTGYIHSD